MAFTTIWPRNVYLSHLTRRVITYLSSPRARRSSIVNKLFQSHLESQNVFTLKRNISYKNLAKCCNFGAA